MPGPSRVSIVGALAPYADGFASALARQGYVPRVVVYHLRLMAEVSAWLTAQECSVSALATETTHFLAARRAAGHTRYVTGRGLRPLLRYLQGRDVVPATPAPAITSAQDRLLARYGDYLIDERGLGRATVRGYLDALRPFLRSRCSADGLHVDVEHLGSRDVTAFVVAHTPTQSRHGAKMTVCVLRSFLRFLHRDGTLPTALADAVPSVAGWRLAGLPPRLDAVQVQRLLAACDRDTAAGRRDFAILTTLARLGLRAGEVAALRLDDLEWRIGEMVVRGKGARVDRLPMPTDVGAAIAAYVRRGRPALAPDRAVFLRCVAPHDGLTPVGISQVVAAAAGRAGLGTIHAHRLRHFAATHTLRAGGSLTEVQQLLRHRLPQTTAIYAKVDRETLRTIARPWLGGAA